MARLNAFHSWLAKAAATCGFLSYLPSNFRKGSFRTGAGLIGTAFGLATLSWVPRSTVGTFLFVSGGTLVAVVVSDVAEAAMNRVDDPRIVIDEWIGFWVTMALLPRTVLALTLGFILFRIFDVWKAPWVRRAGELPGGWGVVFDDVLAGVCANVVLRLITYAHAL